MSPTIDDLRTMLAACKATAVKNLLAPAPAPFKKSDDLKRIEIEILARAPEGSDLVGLFDLVRRTARNAGTSEKVLDKMRVAVAYPLPANPFAEGLNEAEHACNEARIWLNSVLSQKTKSKKISSTQSPALAFQLFLVSAILEFRLLHIDYVPAILRSLEVGRKFSILSDKILALPLALNYGSQQNAERRLLILRQGSLKRLKDFLALKESEAFLRRYSSHPANSKADCLNMLEILECEAWQDPLVSRDSVSAKRLSNEKLINAAQKMAMLEMPSVVVAHRSRRIISHSLPPEVLERISGSKIPAFKLVRSDWLRANKVDDDPRAEVPNEEGEGMPWLGVLREALGENQTDETLLKELAAGASGDVRILASFALYLARPRGEGRQRYMGGGCASATVRRYCLLISTKVVPRVSNGALLRVTEDAWEDALEEIIDEDAFYHVRKYTKQPSSNAQTHSRPLVKAIRHWLHFLSQYREDLECKSQEGHESRDASVKNAADADQAAMPESRSGLTKLAERLPVLGLVKVDASLITVDEYLEVWRRVGDRMTSDSENYRSARRVALTLGYRCGLRRAEVQWLRLIDFDDTDFLHVRPTEMRALKTSNARRDLPLALLMPPEELEKIQERLAYVRRLAKAKNLSTDQTLLFCEPDHPTRPMDFTTRVLRPIEKAFRGSKARGWSKLDESFHFHRLRHSFATIQLLRLFGTGLHKIASHIFRTNAKATMRWVGNESRNFRKELLGDHVTEADLQAIALLLGHGSAATSLEHYIHVLDWYERPGTWDKTKTEAQRDPQNKSIS